MATWLPAVEWQTERQTDGHTDRPTDGQTDGHLCWTEREWKGERGPLKWMNECCRTSVMMILILQKWVRHLSASGFVKTRATSPASPFDICQSLICPRQLDRFFLSFFCLESFNQLSCLNSSFLLPQFDLTVCEQTPFSVFSLQTRTLVLGVWLWNLPEIQLSWHQTKTSGLIIASRGKCSIHFHWRQSKPKACCYYWPPRGIEVCLSVCRILWQVWLAAIKMFFEGRSLQLESIKKVSLDLC